jgi:hypothetical protein
MRARGLDTSRRTYSATHRPRPLSTRYGPLPSRRGVRCATRRHKCPLTEKIAPIAVRVVCGISNGLSASAARRITQIVSKPPAARGVSWPDNAAFCSVGRASRSAEGRCRRRRTQPRPPPARRTRELGPRSPEHPRLYWGEVGNDLVPALIELPISNNH